MILIVIAESMQYVDVATHFRYEFLSDDFDQFMIALLVGILMTFTGLIGWARRSERTTRRRMAAMVFASPWVGCAVGYPIDGINVHGAAPLVLLLVVPASILAIILLTVRPAKEINQY